MNLINLIVTGAKAFSRERYKIGEFIRAWQRAAAKSRKRKETDVNTADLKSALNRVWFYKRFEKTGCLEEGILVQCTIFTRYELS